MWGGRDRISVFRCVGKGGEGGVGASGSCRPACLHLDAVVAAFVVFAAGNVAFCAAVRDGEDIAVLEHGAGLQVAQALELHRRPTKRSL